MATHSSPSKDCTCSKCNAKAHSIAGKPHRRCSGQTDQSIKAKHEALPGPQKGTWQ